MNNAKRNQRRAGAPRMWWWAVLCWAAALACLLYALAVQSDMRRYETLLVDYPDREVVLETGTGDTIAVAPLLTAARQKRVIGAIGGIFFVIAGLSLVVIPRRLHGSSLVTIDTNFKAVQIEVLEPAPGAPPEGSGSVPPQQGTGHG
jgi:hypothetical protein